MFGVVPEVGLPVVGSEQHYFECEAPEHRPA